MTMQTFVQIGIREDCFNYQDTIRKIVGNNGVVPLFKLFNFQGFFFLQQGIYYGGFGRRINLFGSD